MKNKAFFNYSMCSFFIIFFVISIVYFPKESVDAARNGLYLWFNILVPSLLPFLIASYILIDLKILDILGIFIQPLSKFLFNVSGKGSLIFIMSISSGYPIGSKLTSQLRLQNEISKAEAQRLACFCSTSGPLFIIGAVGIGMFKSAQIGYFIAFTHYISALILGILFRYYKRKEIINSNENKNLLFEIKKIIRNKTNLNQNFYTILGDSIKDSINTMLTIGGFVIIFSVLLKIFQCMNVIDSISYIFFIFLSKFQISKELIHASLSGLFEITLGCNNVVNSKISSDIIRVGLCSFIISFSGLSIIAQSCNFLNKTDINLFLFIISKFIHGIISFILTFIFYPSFKTYLHVNTLFNLNIYDFDYKFTQILEFNKFMVCVLIFMYIILQSNKFFKKN